MARWAGPVPPNAQRGSLEDRSCCLGGGEFLTHTADLTRNHCADYKSCDACKEKVETCLKGFNGKGDYKEHVKNGF